jgi:Flp pilus assembly protein TadG
MTRHRQPRGADDRGFSALEVVILVPVIFALFGVLIFGGRRQAVTNDLGAAAQTGARTISIAREPQAAVGAAHAAADATLEVGSVRCASSTFAAEVGVEEVTVTVACAVALADLTTVLPLPGTVTLTASATEVIDIWSERP